MTDPSVARRDDDSPNQILWLARLRWAAIAGQVITIVVAEQLIGIDLNVAPLLTIIGIEVAVNVTSPLLARRPGQRRVVFSLLIFDILVLTALLAYSGGATNPFNFLYLVHIVLALVLLGARAGWFMTVTSALLFGWLFVLLPAGGGHDTMMDVHLKGMWWAFVIAAALIVLFLSGIMRDAEKGRAALERARQGEQRSQQLASLATLAAGAAHELSTPLSTLAVISQDMVQRLREVESDESMIEDARIVRTEVDRCREILEQMAIGVGRLPGEAPSAMSVEELLETVTESMDRVDRVRCRLADDAQGIELHLPRRVVEHAMRALINNALDASTGCDPDWVDVVATIEASDLVVEVVDSGAGIAAEDLQRVVEPFFTTKPFGRGAGLGLFLADSVARQLGGTLTIVSDGAGDGTRAVLRIPTSVMAVPA